MIYVVLAWHKQHGEFVSCVRVEITPQEVTEKLNLIVPPVHCYELGSEHVDWINPLLDKSMDLDTYEYTLEAEASFHGEIYENMHLPPGQFTELKAVNQ